MKPYTVLNMAMSLDGKITTRDGAGAQFTSKADKVRLREIRSQADAILVGAGTISADDPTFTSREAYRALRLQRGMAPNPIKAVVSGSGSISETARMFQPNGAPALVFTTQRIPASRLERLREVAEVYRVGETTVDFQRVLEILRETCQVMHLLIEGGGQVNSDLFHAGLIDEVYLTLSPKIIGGRDVPTIVEGDGFDFLDIVELALLDHRVVDDEIFLHYRVRKS
ncbi:MAG: dihydrofolate reductase family protein [Candidatus Poribacteria bacterium]|nr:dihydrofolate reductase family protein [Candidatus Poribacteria bacterium]